MIEEQISLLAFQQALGQVAPDLPWVGQSVADTIKHCLTQGLDTKAEKLRGDYKVSDKRCELTSR